jgi:hypothetical protein
MDHDLQLQQTSGSSSSSSTESGSVLSSTYISPVAESFQESCRPSSLILYRSSADTNLDDDDDDIDETMHVLFGLSGNDPGFLAEFQVALKSVLLNAPVVASSNRQRQESTRKNHPGMVIHVMADHPKAVQSALEEMTIVQWKMRIPVAIQIHSVDDTMLKNWKDRVDETMDGIRKQFWWRLRGIPVYRHTVGQYFRLFFSDVLAKSQSPKQRLADSSFAVSSPESSSAVTPISLSLSPRHPVKHVLYLDTDAVVMANLAGLWKLRSDHFAFQWGAEMVSAFMLLNTEQLDEIWEIYKTVDVHQVRQIMDDVLRGRHVADDQMLLQIVNVTHPDRVGVLPKAWDVSYMDGPWWATGDEAHYHRPESMPEFRPAIGMLHFNGGGGSKKSYFLEHEVFQPKQRRNEMKQEMLVNSWGQAKYYVDLSWNQARFLVESEVVDKNECYQIDLLMDDMIVSAKEKV